MPETAKPASVVVSFPGLVTNVDPRDLAAGAAEEQVNIACVEPGEITTRRGLREVQFES